MMPKLTFEFSSYEELKGFCTTFCQEMGAAPKAGKAAKAESEDEEPAKKKTAPKDEDVEPAKKKKTPKPDAEDEEPAGKKKAAPKEDEEDDAPTYEQLRASMQKLLDTDQEDQIPVIIEKYSATDKISGIPKEKFAPAIKAFEKAYSLSSPNGGK